MSLFRQRLGSDATGGQTPCRRRENTRKDRHVATRPAPSHKQWVVHRRGREPERQTTSRIQQTQSCLAKCPLQARRNSPASSTATTQWGGALRVRSAQNTLNRARETVDGGPPSRRAVCGASRTACPADAGTFNSRHMPGGW